MRKHDETAENLHAVLLSPFALIKLKLLCLFPNAACCWMYPCAAFPWSQLMPGWETALVEQPGQLQVPGSVRDWTYLQRVLSVACTGPVSSRQMTKNPKNSQNLFYYLTWIPFHIGLWDRIVRSCLWWEGLIHITCHKCACSAIILKELCFVLVQEPKICPVLQGAHTSHPAALRTLLCVPDWGDTASRVSSGQLWPREHGWAGLSCSHGPNTELFSHSGTQRPWDNPVK